MSGRATTSENTSQSQDQVQAQAQAAAKTQTRQGTPERLALCGVLTNSALAVGKLTAGVLGNSFALVADAIESMADVAGSLVIWGALHYGAKAPDEEHPFGHGKAEALAAMAIALLIVVAGLGIAIQAAHYIVTPHAPPAPYTLWVLLIVIAVKGWLYRKTKRVADQTDSAASRADAWHHRSDAITSFAAAIGISIALIGTTQNPDANINYAAADDWAALIASGLLLLNGIKLMREPYAELMDQHLPDIANQCTQIVADVPGVCHVERCDARKAGRHYRLLMHVEVDPNMTVDAAHRLTGIAKQNVRQQFPNVSSLEIHIEPHYPRNPRNPRKQSLASNQ